MPDWKNTVSEPHSLQKQSKGWQGKRSAYMFRSQQSLVQKLPLNSRPQSPQNLASSSCSSRPHLIHSNCCILTHLITEPSISNIDFSTLQLYLNPMSTTNEFDAYMDSLALAPQDDDTDLFDAMELQAELTNMALEKINDAFAKIRADLAEIKGGAA